jgi:ATP-dependent Lon protease
VLAAITAGIKTVYLPEKNRKDFEELPDYAKENIQAQYYESVLDLLASALPDSFRSRTTGQGENK